ncbi:hypothetical protein RFI_08552 [Reticulomyxa filosa]|uniref:Uncharacterized protein n=1 Tax=Reticulomyxa filosa TaxID=46433 RepID=X6NRL2_RETFI|nr:hypothetical protein RFI_08552 [Reticulomyxa filosa]|eukprot:ETO28578.1 hypothetical protein RFI_08552 [Reticulomyxa filosa]
MASGYLQTIADNQFSFVGCAHRNNNNNNNNNNNDNDNDDYHYYHGNDDNNNKHTLHIRATVGKEKAYGNNRPTYQQSGQTDFVKYQVFTNSQIVSTYLAASSNCVTVFLELNFFFMCPMTMWMIRVLSWLTWRTPITVKHLSQTRFTLFFTYLLARSHCSLCRSKSCKNYPCITLIAMLYVWCGSRIVYLFI